MDRSMGRLSQAALCVLSWSRKKTSSDL